MEWVLAILFIVSASLLGFSLYKIKESSKKEQREIDTIYFSMTEEMKKIQTNLRNLELDLEIVAQSKHEEVSPNMRKLLRELLDLYKRGYSIESIAAQKQLGEEEVENLLAPFRGSGKERSTAIYEG